MALVKCDDCGREVSTEAVACPHCGRPTNADAASISDPASTQPPQRTVTPTQPVTSTQPVRKKNWFLRHKILTGILALIAIGAISSAGLQGGNGSGSSSDSASNPPAALSTPPAPNPPPPPPASNMTTSQEQAVKSAEAYLSTGSGFSRAGLIQQLSSSAGEGFSRADAVFAVNHLRVNWNAQAVKSAKAYMSSGSGFSRAGLIQQLSSSAGEGFTYAQAVYAANQVGL
jgi:hypothetical protein